MATFESLKSSEAYRVLSELNIFNPSELDAYLFLLTHNPATVLEITKGIKRYRANVYDTLKRLIEKGFVQESVQDKKKMFFALDPEKIKQLLHQKQQDFDLVLPRLSEAGLTNNHAEYASITRGVFALRSAFNDFLKIGEPIYAYGIPLIAVDYLGEGFMQEYHKQRKKKKIMMYHIYNRQANERIEKLNKLKYTQAKHLAAKYDSNVSTNICGDR